jgi:formate dehydrogenase subunit gamma
MSWQQPPTNLSLEFFFMTNKKLSSHMLARMHVVMIFTCMLLISFLSSKVVAENVRSSQTGNVSSISNNPNPGTDLWRGIVQTTPRNLTTSMSEDADSNILISVFGEQWRQIRMTKIIPISAIVLLVFISILLIFYLIRGKIKIRAGFSTKKLKRYTGFERFIHWSMASCFLLASFSGLLLLFGRDYLIPLIGKEFNSHLLSLAKLLHNYIGPVFIFFLVLMFVKFLFRNIYAKGDLTWLLRGGGIIGGKHVPSGFFNMGEKSLYWMLIIIGGLISVTGLVLNFPIFDPIRELSQVSHILHSISGLIMFSSILGHIYIGTLGMEGAIDGMKTGYCDLNWAKEHHQNWAEDCEKNNKVIEKEA